jgi:hypothetical protein
MFEEQTSQSCVTRGPMSRYVSSYFLLVCLTGCSAGWTRSGQVAPGQYPPRQQVQVWAGGHAQVLHAVRIDSLSVSGIPFQLSPQCDSCRIVIPVTSIDSLRTGNKAAAFNKSIALVFGIAFLWALAWCSAGCPVD